MRKFEFANNEYYHVFNRGVDKRDVFLDEGDYLRFLTSLREFNCVDPIGSLYEKAYKDKIVLPTFNLQWSSASNPQLGIGSQKESQKEPLVELICYCLNPNHFHFILRQLTERGISKFMQKLGMGYTNYFNLKNNRSGALFQGKFNAIEIDSNEDLLWVSAYVNANAQIHGLIKDAADYKWCSYSEYLGLTDSALCNKNVILDKFKDVNNFKKTSDECINQMKEKKDLKRYVLD